MNITEAEAEALSVEEIDARTKENMVEKARLQKVPDDAKGPYRYYERTELSDSERAIMFTRVKAFLEAYYGKPIDSCERKYKHKYVKLFHHMSRAIEKLTLKWENHLTIPEGMNKFDYHIQCFPMELIYGPDFEIK